MKPKFQILSVILVLFILMLIVVFSKPTNRFRLQRWMVHAGSLFKSADPKGATAPTSANAGNNIAFQSADGKIVSLNDLKGKTVFINFWATWCPPCIAEMPSINRLHQKLADQKNIVFLMVDVDANLSKSVAFMKNKQFDLQVFIPASSIPETLLGRGIPVTVIFAPDGKMVFRQEGGANYDHPEMFTFLTGLK